MNRHDSERLEAIIIAAAMEIRDLDLYGPGIKPSALLNEYLEVAKKVREGSDYSDVKAMRGVAIVEMFQGIQKEGLLGRGGLGFNEAVRRIELLSPHLVDDSER